MMKERYEYENFDREFKEIYVNDIKKSVLAFANTEGGVLYIGIADNGEIVGVENTDAVMQQLANSLKDSIAPDVMSFISIKAMQKDDKNIIAVMVEEGSSKPYYLREKGLKPSGVYVRRGSSNQLLSEEGIRKMLIDNQGDSFELKRSIQQELTFHVLKKHFSEKNLPLQQAQMRTLKLIGNDGLYTNLALLLSEQCEHSIKVAVFQGASKSVFRDRKEFTGSLLEQLYEVYAFLDKYNKTKATFKGLDRIDTKDYPEEAVREALLNCLIHRDYSFSGSTLINIYDDRMEFISLGGLAPGLKMETIFIGISQTRNPALAAIFYRLRLIESYGTGIEKICQSYYGSGKKPEFTAVYGGFKVVLPNRNEELRNQFLMAKEEREPYGKKYPVILSDEEKVFEFIKREGYVTRKQVEELLQSKTTKAFNVLQKLCEQGKIEAIGVGKSRKYRIID
ncbi:MAG: RNA-binding domain-containing protein [Erysipelotrichaceae bacterium]